MRIACIHQGFELYGSDRAFIEAVLALRNGFPEADIAVTLPQAGSLGQAFEALGFTVAIEDLWILRRGGLGRMLRRGLPHLLACVRAARRRIDAADLTYVNTAVTLDHILAARFARRPVLIHVHELPAGKTLRVLRAVLRFSGARLLANSKATARAFGLPMAIVPNGAVEADTPPVTYDGSRPLRILMLGRLHRQKGQSVLVEAIRLLPPRLRARLAVRIVGSAFQQPGAEAELQRSVAANGLAQTISVEPFVADPAPLYRWADVVAVPSRWGESLGRVAIEAMAHGRVPVVSATGGLMEVVEHGRSGFLVPPDRADALADRLAAMLEAPDAWAAIPRAAQARYAAEFSPARTRAALCALAREATGQPAPLSAPCPA